MAQAQLSFLLKAYNDASKTLKEVEGDLRGLDGQSKQAASGFATLSGSMRAGFGIIAGATGALIGAGVAVKKLADDYTAYAMQVRELVTLIGATPEEASKLIQVADDMGIAFESLIGAMEAGVRRGVEPTIEGIAALSDEYLTLDAGIERSQFLMEKFGRTGQDLARLMELGGQKIAEMGQSIEGTGLLMTTQGVQAAEEYRVALDELGDAALGAKLKIGGQLAPGITLLVNGMNDWLDANAQNEAALLMLNQLVEAGLMNDAQRLEHYKYLTEGLITLADVQAIYNHELGLTPPVLKQIADGMDIAGGAENRAREGAEELGGALEEAGDKGTEAAAQVAYAWDETAYKLKEKIREAFWDVGDAGGLASSIQDAMDKIDWQQIGGASLERAFERAMDEIPILISQNKITPEQAQDFLANMFVAAQALAVNLGDSTKFAAQRAIQEALDIDATEARAKLEAAMSDPLQIPFTLKPKDKGMSMKDILKLPDPQDFLNVKDGIVEMDAPVPQATENMGLLGDELQEASIAALSLSVNALSAAQAIGQLQSKDITITITTIRRTIYEGEFPTENAGGGGGNIKWAEVGPSPVEPSPRAGSPMEMPIPLPVYVVGGIVGTVPASKGSRAAETEDDYRIMEAWARA
jgi:hypothetical protein